LAEVVACGFSAGKNRFEKELVIVFHVWDEVDVLIHLNNKDALARILLWIGVGQHIEQTSSFDGHNNSLEMDGPLGTELLVFITAPAKGLHLQSLGTLSAVCHQSALSCCGKSYQPSDLLDGA
jgi:hypothetical protein